MGLDRGREPETKFNALGPVSLLLILPSICVVGQDTWALVLPIVGIACGLLGSRSEYRTLGWTGAGVNAFLVLLQGLVILMGGGDRIPPFM